MYERMYVDLHVCIHECRPMYMCVSIFMIDDYYEEYIFLWQLILFRFKRVHWFRYFITLLDTSDCIRPIIASVNKLVPAILLLWALYKSRDCDYSYEL